MASYVVVLDANVLYGTCTGSRSRISSRRWPPAGCSSLMVRALPSEALPGCQPSSPPGRGNCIGTPVASDVRIGAVELELLDAVGGPDLEAGLDGAQPESEAG